MFSVQARVYYWPSLGLARAQVRLDTKPKSGPKLAQTQPKTEPELTYLFMNCLENRNATFNCHQFTFLVNMFLIIIWLLT